MNLVEADAAPPPDGAGRRPLPRTVVLMGWVSFFADVSSEMVYPLLPLFVVGVLHASATALGLIEGVAAALVAALAGWAGWRSDRGGGRGRLALIRWGYGLPAPGKTLLAFAAGWPMVLLGRAVDRFGKGLRGSPRDALLAEAAPPHERGRVFGFHRTMDTAGATVGVFAAAALLWLLGGASDAGSAAPERAAEAAWAFRVVFGISAALATVAMALAFLVREPNAAERSPAAARRSVDRPDASDNGSWLGLAPSYWRVFAMLVLFALANSSDAFLLLQARAVGLPPWAVVLAYGLYNLVYAALSYPAGIVSDRIGRWKVIGLGWSLYAAVYLGFAFATTTSVWPLLAIYGAYMALTDGVGKALIADHAPAGRRGTALGLFHMASGFAAIASSVFAGLLWDRVGHAAPFLFGTAAAGGALALLAFAARKPARAA